MYKELKNFLTKEIQDTKDVGLYKERRTIITPQMAAIEVQGGKDVLSFCANNYLGLSDNLRPIKAVKDMMDSHGYGVSGVCFICDTQDIHKQLEQAIAHYLHAEDAIFHAACSDTNGGVFEPLFGPEDAIISDSLNHASIIDGVRLCKVKRYRHANANMEELEKCLQETQEWCFRIIVTDGVFSMDGNVAPMDKIRDLADKYDALVMVDECHSAGVVGKAGRGVAETFDCSDRIDTHTGMLGKALNDAIGGFTTGPKGIIEMLRQRSRPYLFSNSLSPVVAGAGPEASKMLREDDSLHIKLMENVKHFRDKMFATGFDIRPTQSAIYAVMLYDAPLSQRHAARLLEEGIYVTGFYYPVALKGEARIRAQLSAAHEREHLDKAIAAFTKVGRELGVIK